MQLHQPSFVVFIVEHFVSSNEDQIFLDVMGVVHLYFNIMLGNFQDCAHLFLILQMIPLRNFFRRGISTRDFKQILLMQWIARRIRNLSNSEQQESTKRDFRKTDGFCEIIATLLRGPTSFFMVYKHCQSLDKLQKCYGIYPPLLAQLNDGITCFQVIFSPINVRSKIFQLELCNSLDIKLVY